MKCAGPEAAARSRNALAAPAARMSSCGSTAATPNSTAGDAAAWAEWGLPRVAGAAADADDPPKAIATRNNTSDVRPLRVNSPITRHLVLDAGRIAVQSAPSDTNLSAAREPLDVRPQRRPTG